MMQIIEDKFVNITIKRGFWVIKFLPNLHQRSRRASMQIVSTRTRQETFFRQKVYKPTTP